MSAPFGQQMVPASVSTLRRWKYLGSFSGKKTPLIAPGKSAKLTVTLKAGKQAYTCTVPGHAAAGMKGTLKVT